MKKLQSFATHHPVLFSLGALLAWLAVWITFLTITSSALGMPFTEVLPMTLSRLFTILCVLLFLWRMGWLKDAGVTRLGRWTIWLISLGGLFYIIPASLFSFFGKVTFDTVYLFQHPGTLSVILSNLVVAINEEIFFRGLVLLVLLCAWGVSKAGLIRSVLLTSLIFSVPHLMQVLSGALSYQAALLLILQTLVISFWWGALVVFGGSIWPVVLAHYVGNTVVVLQALTPPLIETGAAAYMRLLLFSLPLGVLGILLLVKTNLRRQTAQQAEGS